MNTVLEQLLAQSKLQPYYDEQTGQIEKFAELIVRECVGLIRQQSIGEEVLGGQRYKTIQLGETIATITEHFGIEE